MHPSQAVVVLNWVQAALQATRPNDPAFKAAQDFEAQLAAALRVQIGPTDQQQLLLSPRLARRLRNA
jgi:hypothetical protein